MRAAAFLLGATIVVSSHLFGPSGEGLADPEPDSIVIEDFEAHAIDSFPRNWDWRGWGEVTEKPYRVQEEDGNRFLRAEDTGQNVVLYKGFRWNIKKYPFIGWRWRIRAVPEGADERYEETADSAAGLYLTYGRRFGLVPKSLKFVWSTALPVGTALRRKGIGMPWTVVAGTGLGDLNRWQVVTFDAVEAYRKTFGGDPPDRPLGVGILSDANNTGTKAYADYDDIVVSKHAEISHRVDDVLVLK
jgi:hypothetical protein